MVLGCQHAGGHDGDFFIFGQKRHGSQRCFRTNRPPQDEIRFFVQNQFFHGQKRLTHRNERLLVPGIDDFHLKGSFYTAHVNTPGGIDFINGQLYAPLGIPSIKKGR